MLLKTMNKTITNIIGYTTYFSMFIPMVVLGVFQKHHDCQYDKCLIINTEGRFGSCIESTIDNICVGIAVMWFLIIMGSTDILSKCKNAISPFIVAALVITMAIVLACIDPSKWEFALSLTPSFILLIIATYIDR